MPGDVLLASGRPVLVVPYRKYERRWIDKDGTSVQETTTMHGNLYFLPETFAMDVGVDTELSARGIYQARLELPA